MTIDKILLFFVAIFLEALVPENNFFIVTAQSLKYGYFSSLWGSTGVVAAQILFLILFVFGFNILETQYHTVFSTLRICGALYIIFLGLEIFYESLKKKDITTVKPAKKGELFIQGFLSHTLNPKAFLLWTALIPQVLPAANVSLTWPVSLGLIAIVTEFSILNLYAWLAHKGSTIFTGQRFVLARNVVAGSFFLCLGIYLLV